MLGFELANIRVEGQVHSHADFPVRIVAGFSVCVDGRSVYEDTDFCAVEFGLALGRWLCSRSRPRSDFVYTSMEAAEEGVVRFMAVSDGLWNVSSAFEPGWSGVVVPDAELLRASRAYLRVLRAWFDAQEDATFGVADPREQDRIRGLIAGLGSGDHATRVE